MSNHNEKGDAREFYHNAGLVEALPEGSQLLVTANDKAKFLVTKGVRPRMTRALAERRSVAGGKGKFDGVGFLKSLKR